MSDVEWKKLNFYISLKRGKRVIKSELSNSSGFPVFQNSLVPLGYFGAANRDKNTTFIICAGAAGEVGYCETPFWAADDCFTVECSSNVDNKYIYYLLLQIKPIIKTFVRKASVPRLSSESILKIRVNLPSFKQQQDIVDKLDTFTTLISRLESELELRQKQYEHYREELLNFEGDEEVEWKTLGDICRIMNGKDYKNEGVGLVPVYGSGGIMTYIDKSVSSGPSVLLPRKGSLNNVFYVDSPFWTVDTIYWTKINDEINPKYFYYFMLTKDLEALCVSKGAVPSMTQAILNKILIPIPPKHRQQQIVSQLDTFEQLISALKREIALRRKQYEYYREKLLTFD